jgi:NADPH-dependent glutamate synthase beta subunit-like oxidoreductase/ferredoxin
MDATNVEKPSYYEQVVNCQHACPAHTDVPGYIRLIAQGKFDEAYLMNREANVFPGILGRVCDRPCEPACRRGRVDGEPVAICRLKRVAADLSGDVREFLPTKPSVMNGKKIVCVGAGPASLTVANDLAPLGYEVTVLEQWDKPGGLMRSNIPSFRLPESVLDEEIGIIADMGVEIRYNSPVSSMKELLAQGYDAVFVGTGAPRGKELELPGRFDETGDSRIHIGIDWLESVAFGHRDEIGERVLIIGVGNTAMDCCRTSLRLGGRDVKVMARRPREFFKASPWELDDAEAEGVEIVINHAPTRFVLDNGRLTGVEFEVLAWDEGAKNSTVLNTVVIPCDDVILAIGQENYFPWIEADLGFEVDKWGQPVVNETTFASSVPTVFFGGDSAFGPKNIIWAVEHGHQAALSIDAFCQGRDIAERPAPGMNLASQKMGMAQWRYHNDYNPSERQLMNHVALAERFTSLNLEVELGYSVDQYAREVERCLNCDVQTAFSPQLCIECDACMDICPVQCLTITENGDEADLRTRLRAPADNLAEPLFVSAALSQTGRVMVKDENVCVHCGMCADRCPTAAWDMSLFELASPKASAATFIPVSIHHKIKERS